MRLHGDVRIEMIQGTIRLLTTLPTALVHALNLFETTSRALCLLRAGNGDERVDLRERMRLLFKKLSKTDRME